MENKRDELFTSEQRLALSAEGQTIVSASAGSGKTTVMIEKIVRLIRSGESLQRVLALTYTNKAASQMKDKLHREMIKAINDPSVSKEEKAHLKAELPLVPSANVSTIHSFCSRLIRSHFFLAELSPDFSVLAELSEEEDVKGRAIDRLFDEMYESGDEDFSRLLSVFFRKKKDTTLKTVVLDAYGKLRTRADYRNELEKFASSPATDEDFLRVADGLLSFVKADARLLKISLEELKATADGDQRYEKTREIIEKCLQNLDAVENAETYFSLFSIPFANLPSAQPQRKNAPEDEQAFLSRASNLKKECTAFFKGFSDGISEEQERSSFRVANETSRALAKLLLAFDEKFTEEKKEKNALDFNDLEHVALSLLQNETVQTELKNTVHTVFVDEYQDVNPVQEQILTALTGENLFLVGDVKQSIYAFRGSSSEYFSQKFDSFEKDGENGDEKKHALYLTKNFRSALEILDAVNVQFSHLMTKELCAIDYEGTSQMQYGGLYGEHRGTVQVHFLDNGEKEEKTKAEKEKRHVYSVMEKFLENRKSQSKHGEMIRDLIFRARKSNVYDIRLKKTRPVEYGDIAILTRKNTGDMPELTSALVEAGIPVSASAEVNLLSYPEIRALVDFLSLIDNTEQDVPLCSALLSPIGKLTIEEASLIRLAYPWEGNYRQALKKYASEKNDLTAQKLNEFFAYIEKIRTFSFTATAGEVLTRVLAETGAENKYLARDGGALSLKRIRYFLAQTETPSPMTVYEFLDKLRLLGGVIPYQENGGENAVKLMTIHASKGLEFPVVIFDAVNDFRGREEYNWAFDSDFGLCTYAYLPETMIKRKTLLWELIKRKEQAEDVKNELNLFYVGLTRAMDTLHVVFEKREDAPRPTKAKNYADFVDFSLWEKYLAGDEPFDLEKAERQAFVNQADEETTKKILEQLSWQYPFAGGENLPVKTSATSLMKETDVKKEEFAPVPKLFDESEEENDLRLTGLAYHAFLEKCDLSRCESVGFVEAELARLKESGAMTEDEIGLLDVEILRSILAQKVFAEVKDTKLFREQKFMAMLPSKEIYPDMEQTDLETIVQGAIDLLSVSDDGKYRIIDYKFSSRSAEDLKTHYAPQLALYKKAVQKIMGARAEDVRCTIVNLRLGYFVELSV